MEEFNIYDLYLNQVKQDDVYNSKEYKFLKDNNIDAVPVDGSPLEKLIEELPFDETRKITVKTNWLS